MLDKLMERGVNMEKSEQEKRSRSSNGKTFVFTGTLHPWTERQVTCEKSGR
jgi:NAD-dependent DNA ligase